MEHLQNPRRASRSTFGEALIVVSIVAGFFWMFSQDKVSLQDIWTLAGLLFAVVIFYMALLFCRMLFFWMTGGDQAPYSWWDLKEMQKKK